MALKVGELFASMNLKDEGFNKGLDSAVKAITSGVFNAGLLDKALGVLGDAMSAAAKGITEMVSSFADYEQLVGGVETLFGANGQSLEEYAAAVGQTTSSVKADYEKMIAAQETVMNNAANAYKTAGLSANQYMETVTSFAASMVSSLGGDTAKAAELSNMAITDMADNMNKMGSRMEDIQHAYQGFAKQNYTMLDNLNTMGALAA